jgi:signal transduction histidine kinase
MLQADSQKLEIALLNLIINAVEAVDNETGKIILGCEELENNVHFTIADNGIGMNEEELKVLFDPFYTNKKGGVGLGLTTTQNIINAHQGKIQVESKYKEGTTFTVKLPVYKND